MRPNEIELVRRDYEANGGWETFLSYEDPEQVGIVTSRGSLCCTNCWCQAKSNCWCRISWWGCCGCENSLLMCSDPSCRLRPGSPL